MKTVTIFTYNRSYNFGANLQSFALMSYLRKLGYQTRIIDTRHKDDILNIYPRRKGIKGTVTNLSNFLHRKQLILGRQRFNSFGYDEGDHTENFYSEEQKDIDFTRLEDRSPLSDVYLSGSDQVFSPSLMSRLYFLDFDTKGAKKISYAASLGVDCIPNDKKKVISNLLNGFECLSVREISAKNALSDLYGKNITVNIDPTFLLLFEEWEKEERRYDKLYNKKYILAYFIYRPKEMNKWLKELKKSTGLPIVVVDTNSYRNIYHDHIILDAGPKEFLWLIHNAEMVITSSFHGTAFSIIYRKPFIVCNSNVAPTRIENLIKLFGLENHLIKQQDGLFCSSFDLTAEEKECIQSSIDYEIKRAQTYLIESIEN